MPKTDVDYSNTIIYKIVCKDETIVDVYVGHTTNFVQRKYTHKIACNNLNNNLKIYNVIRCNGGWDNWNMIEIAKYNCKDVTEARIKEQQHYDILKASLNSCPPYVDMKKYFCSECNLQCMTPKQYETHINCNKHMKAINKSDISIHNTENDAFAPKSANFFECSTCNYKCCKKSDITRHLTTQKHARLTMADTWLTVSAQNAQNAQKSFECVCGNLYKHRQSLFKHEKVCKELNKQPNDNNISTAEILNIIKTLIKDNQDFTKELVNSVVSNQSDTIKEITKCGITNTTNNVNNNSNNNSNNKTFNLQVFLNETCKNAMNLTDFIDSIKLQLSDLIKIGEIGYVEGISNIITSNLQSLDITQRPIHCTDKKRETVYVKDEDKWEKDDDNNNKIRKLIKKVAYKNENLLPQYKQKHPGCNYSESKYADQYSKIVIEAMSGDKEKDDKIIKNISKAITINKENY